MANVSEKTSVFLTQPKTGRSLVNFALPFVL
ncbi:int domain protein, partial [Escherichia coli FRIK1985]